jgi:hypothetical protein
MPCRLAAIGAACALILLSVEYATGMEAIFGARSDLKSESPGSPRKETDAIKAKLESAEDRVRELVAKLDSFSIDASLAKAEIHSSFIETWQNVEVLARDRCGTELQSIRASQQKAEAQVERMQEEFRAASQHVEDLKVLLSRAGHAEQSLKSELAAERSRRELLDAEVGSLRDKLHWATAKANETRSYDIVAERLEALLLIVSERANILGKVQQLVSDHHAGFEDWVKEIDNLAHMVRDSDLHLTSDLATATADAQSRRVNDLERRLKDALKSRDDAIAERNDMRTAYNKLRTNKLITQPHIVVGERSSQALAEGMSMVGVATACVMTLLCGSLLLLFCGWGSRQSESGNRFDDDSHPTVASSEVRNAGSKPTGTPGPSGFYHSPSSPMTYVSPGSGQRGSTPRRY